MPNRMEPTFRTHRDCAALTKVTLELFPRDGSIGRRRSYGKGESVWHSDDPADSVFFLARGSTEVLGSDPAGHEVVFRIVETGSAFGELCFCAPRKGARLNSARALADSEVLEIKLAEFFDYLQHNQTALLAMTCMFCSRLSEMEERVEVLSYRKATDRLGRLLLQLAMLKRAGEKSDAECISLGLSHEQLARMGAMSRPQVTLTMLKFRHLGLIRYGRTLLLSVNLDLLMAYLNRRGTISMSSTG